MQSQINIANSTQSFRFNKESPSPFFVPSLKPLRTYEHEFETYLKDSNAYTNIYFSRYFEWQGICRESWFQKCITRDLLQSEGVLITKTAHNDYLRETFPFQNIKCLLNTYHVKQCSFYIVFRFFENGELISNAYQQVVFADLNKRITRFPEFIIKKVRQYEISDQ